MTDKRKRNFKKLKTVLMSLCLKIVPKDEEKWGLTLFQETIILQHL